MASEKVCYWVALGVLTLVVSNNFLTRHEDVTGNLVRRSLTVAEQVSDHATSLVATAGLTFDRNSTGFARTEAKVACARAQLASMQTILARREAGFAQLEAQRARVIFLEPAQRTVVCPRQKLRPIPAL